MTVKDCSNSATPKKKLLIRLSGLLIPLISFAHPAYAATSYYVAPNGSDSNPGTITQPFRTIEYAVGRLTAGTTLLMRGGTYRPTRGVWLGQAGTSTAPITIQPYPGEQPVIDGTNMPQDTDCVSIGGSFINVKGIECKNAKRVGINLYCAHNINILDNKVHDAFGTGIAGFCWTQGNMHDLVIKGNTVFHNVLSNKARTANGGWGTGMAVLRGTNVTLANNKVYENYGEGLGCFTSTNCLIQDNTIYDNFSAELYIANSTNVTAERNLIYSKGNTAYFRNLSGVWGPATGILLGDEGCGDPVRITLNNVIVRNNIVVNGRNGFTYAAFDCFDHGMQTTQVVNNTFYGSTEALLVINYNSNNTGNSVANNIFFQTKGKPITMLGDLKSVTYSNNLWFGGAPESVAVSQSDLRADPLFSVPGSVRAIDYQFKTGSPAIDKGKAISATFNDYFGTVRPSGNSYDIGAYEFRYFSTARSSGKSHNISANEPRESHEAMRSRILPQRKVQQPRLNLCQKSIREAFSSASISRQKTTSSRQARQQLMQGRRSGQQPTLPSAVPTRLARATTAAHTSSVRPCDRASYPSTKPNPT